MVPIVPNQLRTILSPLPQFGWAAQVVSGGTGSDS